MRRTHRTLLPAAVAALALAACGGEGEYSDRPIENETDPPAVGSTAIDSAAAGARIDTTGPLDAAAPESPAATGQAGGQGRP